MTGIMNWRDHISSNPSILFGKAAITGTRIPVDLILERLGYGETIESLLEGYPALTREDVLACLLFASENAKHEKVISADV